MKRLLTLALALALLVGAVGALSEGTIEPVPGYVNVEVPDDMWYDSEIVNTYIQEFANLTQVPHASFKTAKMAEYLTKWAETRGVESYVEEVGNVIFYVPATEGYEDAPVVIFQGHIDMVPAVDEGIEHDWDNDPLELVWTAPNSVKANGTTLGADNGTGVAFALTYIDYIDDYVHGPLRFIFTVEEEVGLIGAHNLDPKYLDGAAYMINIDGGYGGAVISCAGGNYYRFSHAAEWVYVPEGYIAYDLEFKNLKGGHSAGVGGGKANGLVAMSDALVSLDQAGIEFNLVTISGGNANNAIPTGSKATIVLAEGDAEAATAKLDAFNKLFKDSFVIETDYTFTYGASDAAPEKALTADLSVRFLQLMSLIPNNIHTLLATASGTETSANLGTIAVTDESIEFVSFMRSSNKFNAEQITLINTALAELADFSMDIPTTFATWPLKPDNKLSDIAAALFLEMTGEEYRLSAIHAGVECGEFAEKNPDMYIISTGVSGGSAGHTTAEAMNFDKVQVSIEFLTGLATKLVEKE